MFFSNLKNLINQDKNLLSVSKCTNSHNAHLVAFFALVLSLTIFIPFTSKISYAAPSQFTQHFEHGCFLGSEVSGKVSEIIRRKSPGFFYQYLDRRKKCFKKAVIDIFVTFCSVSIVGEAVGQPISDKCTQEYETASDQGQLVWTKNHTKALLFGWVGGMIIFICLIYIFKL